MYKFPVNLKLWWTVAWVVMMIWLVLQKQEKPTADWQCRVKAFCILSGEYGDNMYLSWTQK